MEKEKKNKPKNKKEKTINIGSIFIIIIAIIITVSLFILIIKIHDGGKVSSNEPAEVKVDDSIDKYGYELMENTTTYYKELFNKLKILLNTEGYEEVEYAKLIGQMFAADFYNLDNKLTNSDIGGASFVVDSYQSNFKLAAQNSIYNSVKNNIYNDRDQKLPKVSSVDIIDITTTTFKYGNNVDSKAYQVKLSITYEEDLGYPKNVSLILVHNNDKLEVAKVG